MTMPDADPFFRIPDTDRTWNACIGPQGGDENYVDGYIDAALLLATTVVDREMLIARDTLVLPILYTARHGIELAFKFAIKNLHEAGAIAMLHPINHDIHSHWEFLRRHKPADKMLDDLLVELNPFVESLSGIDRDGQQLRYSVDQEGKLSLKDRPLANIAVIRDSLVVLQELLLKVRHRVLDLARDFATGTHTADCSRRDLMSIALMLPARDTWASCQTLLDTKNLIKQQFSLSSNKLGAAIDVIQANRELGGLLGIEFALKHLTDEHAGFVFKRWLILHPPKPLGSGADIGLDYSGSRDLEAAQLDSSARVEAYEAVIKELEPEEVSDLETIFYLGRDRDYPEYYEQRLEGTMKQHRQALSSRASVHHLFSKMNLLDEVVKGVRRLGRARLAAELLKMRTELLAQSPRID